MNEVDPAFGNWLAGFVDGEGCFVIVEAKKATGNPSSWSTRFYMKVRDDDGPVLEEIVRHTGIGYVRRGIIPPSMYRNNRPQASWTIQNQAGCEELVELFDRFPLRAKKAHDYAVWREAVLLRRDVQNGGDCVTHNAPIWVKVAAMGAQLSAQRKYEYEYEAAA